MNAKQLKELLALAMIGEGVLATVYPREHMLLWRTPKLLEKLTVPLARTPTLTRMLAVLEAGAGFWLASRQFSEVQLPCTAESPQTAQRFRWERAAEHQPELATASNRQEG